MASTAARRAWNDAMKATAGAAALPTALQPGNNTKRRSDRNRKQDRRIKARKGTNSNNNAYGGEHQADRDYRTALWVDMLEGIDPTMTSAGLTTLDDDDEYDELEEFEEETKTAKKRKRQTTASNKRETKKKSKSQVASIPKRYLPKSLGAILIEEASVRIDEDDDTTEERNVAHCFIESEARIRPRHDNNNNNNEQFVALLPNRKFCPVTGTLALYTEPKSGIPYSTFRALEQIRERAPIWMMTTQGSNSNSNAGVASYYEAVKSIEERSSL